MNTIIDIYLKIKAFKGLKKWHLTKNMMNYNIKAQF